ncbi:MAG: SDR family oxidoreductase [Myxococcota bacterium]
MGKTVLVAGSTGYLGKFAVRAFKQRGYRVRALTRSEERLGEPGPFTAPAVAEWTDEVFVGEIMKPETLDGLMDGVDFVFSSIGISRQRDGLTFEEVDHQANRLLIDLAKRAGVAKFVYVSLWGQDEISHLEIVRAHEKVVAALAESGLPHCVVRPSGYFSDMGVLLDMAKKGRSFLVGAGENNFNPIHGADLSEVCVDAMESDAMEIGAGGPDTLTQREAAELAFEVLEKPPNIVVLPMWLMRGGVHFIGLLNTQFGDLFEFIVTAGEIDGVAPSVGTTTLRSYFEELAAAG